MLEKHHFGQISLNKIITKILKKKTVASKEFPGKYSHYIKAALLSQHLRASQQAFQGSDLHPHMSLGSQRIKLDVSRANGH